jgi:hypothetical protein
MAIKKGDLVEVRFLDHVEDGEDPIEFLVWGRVRRTSRVAYAVESWAYADPLEDEADHGIENRKVFTIVKSAIKAIRPLRVQVR